MKELAKKDQMQRKRRWSDLRDGLLSLSIGSTRKACRDSAVEIPYARAREKKKNDENSYAHAFREKRSIC